MSAVVANPMDADGNPRVTERACPCCGETGPDAFEVLDYSPTWPMRRCQRCGFVFLSVVPAFTEFAADLAWEKQFATHAKTRKQKHPLLTWLSKATRWRLWLKQYDTTMRLFASKVPRGKVLDIGCGSGGGMLSLGPDMIPFGVEISPALAAQADAAFRLRGGKVICAPAVQGLQQLEPNSFEGALLRSYLEHEEAPQEVLRLVARLLKPNGIAVVKVPNFGSLNRVVSGQYWSGFRFPDHMNYFTPAGLARMADQAGLDTTLCNPIMAPISDNMYALLRKR